MSQTRGSWVVALRIARREARRTKGRTVLSALMVGLPILALTTVTVLAVSMVSTPESVLREQVGDGAQAVVSAFGCAPVYQSPDVVRGGTVCVESAPSRSADESIVLLATRFPEHEVVPVISGHAEMRTPAGTDTGWLRALDASSPVADTAPVIEGRLPATASEIALSHQQARNNALTLGSPVTLSDGSTELDVTVVGLLPWASDTIAPGASSLALTDVSTSWFLLGDTPVTWTDVVQLNEAGFTALSWDVLLHPPAPGSTPFDEATRHSSNPSDTWFLAQAAAAGGIGLIEVILLVGPAFAVGARRQTRSLALLAAAGADAATLRRVVLAQALTIGAVASSIAVVLGLGVATVIVEQPSYDPTEGYAQLTVPGYLPLFAVAGTVIALAAAWFPARAAARLDVVRALAGRRSDARPRRRGAAVGLAGVAVGAGMVAAGAAFTLPALLAAGAVLTLVGAILCSGSLSRVAGRIATRARPSLRIALRDLSRNRSRSVPAIGAVLTATAVAVAVGTFLTVEADAMDEGWVPSLGEGRVAVDVRQTWEPGDSAARRTALAEDVVAAVLAIDPAARLAVLDQLDPTTTPSGYATLRLKQEESLECPWEVDGVPMTLEQMEADPRCASPYGHGWTTGGLMPDGERWTSLWVDDGEATALLDIPGASEAATALRAGKVATVSYATVGENGWATLVAESDDSEQGPASGPLGTAEATWVPAGPGDLLSAPAILPTAVAQRLGPEWEITPALVVVAPSTPWGVEEFVALTTAVPSASRYVDLPPVTESDGKPLVIAAIGAALAIGAVLVASGLAAAEQRADLGTLAAIGAAPRTRRHVAGFHATGLGLLGVVPGIAVGPLIGTALIKLNGVSRIDPIWAQRLELPPWQLVTILVSGPIVAGLVVAACTPSRLPTPRPATG